MFFLDAIEEMKRMLFVESEDGGVEPAANLYNDVSSGTWKLGGLLLASSICMNGPAPNFMASWIYDYIVGGTEKVLQSLPCKMRGDSNLQSLYNKVSSAYSTLYLALLLNVRKIPLF